MVFETEDQFTDRDSLHEDSPSHDMHSPLSPHRDMMETTRHMEQESSAVERCEIPAMKTTSLDALDIGSAGDLRKKILDENETNESLRIGGGDGRDEKDDDDHLPPPDGGFGWVIVFGSFLAHILIGGLDRSDGMFFLEFESRYGKSAALTAWPGALASMIRLAMGPIASAFSERWSVRASVLVGGFFLGVVMILSAYSASFYFLFVTHGILQGISRGLIYCPSVVIVSMYFEKRRGIATGLAASGVGMGTVLVVPLIQLLFDTYGFTGGFLVLSGVCFNAVFIAMLFRPLFLHYKFIGQKGLSPEKPSAPETVMLSELTDAADTVSVRSVRLRSSSTKTGPDVEASHQLMGKPRNDIVRSVSLHTSDINSHHSIVDLEDHKVDKREGCLKSSLNILFPRQPINPKIRESKRPKQNLFQFDLLKDIPFVSFCLSICLFTAAFKSAFTFIPALAASRGLSTTEAVFVLSVTGFVDTGGRIVSGLIMDIPRLRHWRLVIYCSITFSVAVLSALMPLLGYNFSWLCAVCSVYGMLSGCLVSQKSVMIVDLLGPKKMASGFGLLLLFQAVGVGFGPLLSGAFKDAFGRFNEAFYLGAGLMGVAGCLMAFSAVMHKSRLRREEDKTGADH